MGRDRTHSRTVFSHPPVVTVRAAFTAYGGLMRGFAGPECSVGLGKDSQAFTSDRMTTHPPLTVWPFPLWTVFPSSEYYGHADSLPMHRRFSELFPTHYFR